MSQSFDSRNYATGPFTSAVKGFLENIGYVKGKGCSLDKVLVLTLIERHFVMGEAFSQNTQE